MKSFNLFKFLPLASFAFLLLFASFYSLPSLVRADETYSSGFKAEPIDYDASPCENESFKLAVKVVGKVVSIIQIAVPIILVIMAMIDLLKQILTDNDATSKKNMTGLIKKIISAVLVFFIIAIVKLVLTLIGGDDAKMAAGCTYYIVNPW